MRLRLVCALVESEFSVGELEKEVGVSQPTLSQQLGALREAGIVQTRRDAQRIVYRLAEAKVSRLMSALYAIFCTEEDPS